MTQKQDQASPEDKAKLAEWLVVTGGTIEPPYADVEPSNPVIRINAGAEVGEWLYVGVPGNSGRWMYVHKDQESAVKMTAAESFMGPFLNLAEVLKIGSRSRIAVAIIRRDPIVHMIWSLYMRRQGHTRQEIL